MTVATTVNCARDGGEKSAQVATSFILLAAAAAAVVVVAIIVILLQVFFVFFQTALTKTWRIGFKLFFLVQELPSILKQQEFLSLW